MTLSTLSKISIAALTFASLSVSATIVEFTVSYGTSTETFKVNLHDETTPITVTNFLKYVTDEDYNNTVVHRVEPGFVMQAGGFEFTGKLPLDAIPTDNAIKNEPIYSNVRGTIAMAKVSGNENSATSQWFINLSDNSGGDPKLDIQNGGFTVFGEIVEGMDKVDAIAALSLCGSTPMPNYTAEQCADTSFVPGTENFVTIVSAVVSDSTVNSADSLTPVKNTSIPVTPPVTPTPPKSSSGGGSIAWFGLAFTALVSIRRFFKK
ncbi:peptidylprolyl isomerase [Cognaticolwellia mytili]|uniref:peptidylprolyl isomerase n=1 Tax=Cognaticolwellia mytili TaxID=1888913 RepID=UPI000A170614|nr:peptidylprolyl isomerase [Cognaticolwellia mytili]